MRKMEPCGAFRDPKYLKETSIRKNKLHEKTTMKKVESVSVQLLIYLYDSLYQSRISENIDHFCNIYIIC